MFTHCNPKSIVTKQQINSYFQWLQQPNSGPDRPSVEISRPHTIRHTHTHKTCRAPMHEWPSCHRDCYLHYTQLTQQTNIHALSGIRNRDVNNKPAAHLRLWTAQIPGSAKCNLSNLLSYKQTVQTVFANLLPPGLTLKIYSTFCPQSVFIPLYGSQTKERTFPYTALTHWFANQAQWLLRDTNWIFTYVRLFFRLQRFIAVHTVSRVSMINVL